MTMNAPIDLESAHAPDGMRIYAIGDVHGYRDQLKAMHARIDADLAARPPDDWRIVHVGDYVDRGPDSRGVIAFLAERMAAEPRILALRGNHDQAMLDFLHEPEPDGMFMRYGGAETVSSYGVELDFSDDAAFERSAGLFAAAVPTLHRRFLDERPHSAAFGDYFFCHAGIDPDVPLDRQQPETLMWIRERFLHWDGLHPKVIVHGHTPQMEVDLRPNRINIDIGIYLRQRLAAIVLEGAEKTVLTVGN